MLLRIFVILSLILSATGLGVIGLTLLAPPAPPPAPVVQAPVAPPPPTRLRVLVAARALTLGTLLKDEDFVVREFAIGAAPEGALEPTDDTRGELRGALLRRYLDPGTPILRADVLRPRDRGFLAAVLKPGTRAIAIGVDVVSGTAGLIWPGDQVDMILTQAIDNAPISRRVVGETVLSDVRVIAVDQQITHGGTPAAGADGGIGRIARTVTLEVTPEQAERVAVASRLDRIDLTVRSIELASGADTWDGQAASAASVFGSDVSPALARSALSPGARVRVIQGGETSDVVFR